VNSAPEHRILRALADAAEAVAVGLDEAIGLLQPLPLTAERFTSLDLVQRTAAAALLKRVEQLQDIIARMFRTALIADGADVGGMTARDIANRMEKLGALADARAWSDIVRLRNRLVHEYPVGATEQHNRVLSALDAAPALHRILDDAIAFLAKQELLS
jgi:hypothetical protein